MPPCTSPRMFKPLPMVYDKDDEDLYHIFRKCMFSRRIKSGVYKWSSKESGDWMIYEIGLGGIYERSHGMVNGTPMRIEV